MRAEQAFATSIAGSLPKPSWLAEPNRLWADWQRDDASLAEAKADATRVAILEQELSGIDVVTDGEQSRRHFVHGFLERIEGVDFGRMARRGIRDNRYEADCPTIVSAVRRPRSVHADEARFARTLTRRGLKVTMPGPMTIVDTLNDDFYRDRKTAAFAFADLIAAEIADLCVAGVDEVQLDEPAFNVYFDEVEAWGIAALDRCIADAACTTTVHVCYGYGIKANIDWKQSLGLEWDQYGRVLPMIARSRVDQIAIELAGSHVPPAVLGLAGDKRVAVGVIDVATDRVETPEDVAATLDLAAQYLDPHRIIATTNCGMAPMSRDVAYRKLRAIGEGAALARANLSAAHATV